MQLCACLAFKLIGVHILLHVIRAYRPLRKTPDLHVRKNETARLANTEVFQCTYCLHVIINIRATHELQNERY